MDFVPHVFVAHLVQKLSISYEKGFSLANELIERFLPIKRHLKDYDAVSCSPAPLVDAAWVELMSFSKLYARLCGDKFIHHNPIMTLDCAAVQQARYSNTLQAYKDMFGADPMESDIWPAVYPGLEGRKENVFAMDNKGADRKRKAAGLLDHGDTIDQMPTEYSEAANHDHEIEVFIQMPNGRTVPFHFLSSDTINDVKRVLASHAGISPSKQQLTICDGTQLHNGRRLSACGGFANALFIQLMEKQVHESHEQKEEGHPSIRQAEHSNKKQRTAQNQVAMVPPTMQAIGTSEGGMARVGYHTQPVNAARPVALIRRSNVSSETDPAALLEARDDKRHTSSIPSVGLLNGGSAQQTSTTAPSVVATNTAAGDIPSILHGVQDQVTQVVEKDSQDEARKTLSPSVSLLTGDPSHKTGKTAPAALLPHSIRNHAYHLDGKALDDETGMSSNQSLGLLNGGLAHITGETTPSVIAKGSAAGDVHSVPHSVLDQAAPVAEKGLCARTTPYVGQRNGGGQQVHQSDQITQSVTTTRISGAVSSIPLGVYDHATHLVEKALEDETHPNSSQSLNQLNGRRVHQPGKNGSVASLPNGTRNHAKKIFPKSSDDNLSCGRATSVVATARTGGDPLVPNGVHEKSGDSEAKGSQTLTGKASSSVGRKGSAPGPGATFRRGSQHCLDRRSSSIGLLKNRSLQTEQAASSASGTGASKLPVASLRGNADPPFNTTSKNNAKAGSVGLLKSCPVQTGRSTPSFNRASTGGLLREITGYLQPGIHDHATLHLEKGLNDEARATRSMFKWDKHEISQRPWAELSVVSAEAPVYFQANENQESTSLETLGKQIEADLINICYGNKGPLSHVLVAEEIKRFYLKGHLQEPFVTETFASMIPPCLGIKHLADRKAIAFATTDQPSICDTHFDRDTTLLFLLAGKKEVYLMPRRERLPHEIVNHNSSIFETVDPFSDAEAGKLGSEWKRIVVLPGTALLIPQDWLHAVRSDSHTVGISIQVEIAPTQKESVVLPSAPEKKPRNMLCEAKDLSPAIEEIYSAAFAYRSGGRTRRRCMLCNGPILFLTEEFWFPVLDDEDDVIDKRLPLVAEKFMCLTCVPRTGMAYLEPDQVPKEAAEYVTDYRFFVGSKGDYETLSKLDDDVEISAAGK